MSGERIERQHELFRAALEIDPSRQEEYLRDACAGDVALLESVLQLLAAHCASRSPIDAPAADALGINDSDPAQRASDRSIRIAGAGHEDPAWKTFLKQLRSRGPAHQRYVFHGEIARGGMGVVQRVFDQDAQRHLALKVILGQDQSRSSGGTPTVSNRTLGRFLEEAQITSQLDHPGIVPVHEIGVDHTGRVYFTMRLVEGEDLRTIFRRVRDMDPEWSMARALSVILRVCEALAFAHDKGVIHRDLKPANIMVGRFGEAYVMDWGLARVLGREDSHDLRIQRVQGAEESGDFVRTARDVDPGGEQNSPVLTMDGDVIGTPAYMPPEQAHGQLDDVGAASDVYSLGAILYELLCGQVPYADRERISPPYEVLKSVQEGSPTPLHVTNPQVSAELEAICDKAMARSIEERYRSMEAFARDLRSYLEGRVVAAYETGAIAELRKWVIRNKGTAASIAAAIVATLLLSAWAVFERNVARAANTRADQNEADARILSDSHELDRLKAEMNSIWPAVAARIDEIDGWMGRARSLVSRLDEHEQSLRELRARGTPRTQAADRVLDDLLQRVSALEQRALTTEHSDHRDALSLAAADLERRSRTIAAELVALQPFDFEDDADSWRHDVLLSLVSDLTQFAADDRYGQTLRNMRTRLEVAATLFDRSIADHQEVWSEAIVAIADQQQCPRYAGLTIPEQLGLAPLAQDPVSGLWEFWHVPTGNPPQREEDGTLRITADSALVFVLIPGGSFRMGSQGVEAGAPNHDPRSVEIENDESGNLMEVTLEPFFLSKYEMTQGQWERFTGSNPSWFIASWPEYTSPVHPVDKVSWTDSDQITYRLGLELPTEAQWEYACRAGTSTIYFCGDDVASLAEYANIRDARYGVDFNESGDLEPIDDGYGAPAPVGSLKPNAFGLFNMHGNLAEWCRAQFKRYDITWSRGDVDRPAWPGGLHVVRGGSYGHNSSKARSAARHRNTPENRSRLIGLRPSRALER
ncbi:MAG: hypothetical protein DWP92_00015 [Armatimonadetes bacterium]|nr:MAG: hypothetical protein DWP92_00015 [Armatimonadota bacterium]